MGFQTMAEGNSTSEQIYALEDKYGCRNYEALKVALCRGEGQFIFH